jgi:hypothetical protein
VYWLYWAVLGCIGLYWAVLGCIGLYWAVLMSKFSINLTTFSVYQMVPNWHHLFGGDSQDCLALVEAASNISILAKISG